MRVIAIDGPAGSGKSTIGRRLAEQLGLEYLDTGAMYRGVTFSVLRRGIDPADADVVANVARSVELRVEAGAVTVDGVDATIEIRGPEVTRAVSIVAANPGVREELVRRQREWARARGGGVLEGRDIGTVVYPDAELKVYLTASPEVRAARRSQEVTDLAYETVAADLARRDALDQGRDSSPLAQAEGAVVVDTTDRGVDEIVEDLLARLVPSADEPGPESPASPSAEATPSERRLPRTEGLTTAEQRPVVTRDPLAPPSRLDRVLWRIAWYLLVGLGKALFRLEIRGREHIPASGAAVLAPIHRSNLDFALVVAAASSTRRFRYLAKDSLWKGSWGRLWDALGAIPVHRGSADREALKACIGVVEKGEPVVIFPEGTRQTGPEVAPLFDGAAYVQSRTGVPIIPIGIGGSEAAMPKGSKGVRPRKVIVVIGEPIPAPALEGAKARRQAVRTQTALVGERVQALFDEAQRLAGTPNPDRPAVEG